MIITGISFELLNTTWNGNDKYFSASYWQKLLNEFEIEEKEKR